MFFPGANAVDVAALAEPLSVAWHAVGCSDFKDGETALVLGSGPIGALVTRVLVARGASAVYVSEPSPVRSRIALSCGATSVLDPTKDDVVARVTELTDGRGVDVAIDCAGMQRTLDAAMEGVRKKGRVVMVALWDKDKKPTVDMWVRCWPISPAFMPLLAPLRLADALLCRVLQNLLSKEATLTASCCFNAQDMREVLAALSAGTIKVDDLITSRIRLEEVFDKGLEVLRSDPSQVKILVQLEGGDA